MKITDAVVVWTPTWADSPHAGSIRVERHGSGWQRTPGDLWMPPASLGPYGGKATDRTKQLLAMFILFNTLTVRDGISPNTAHLAFLQIHEYRNAISPDAPGAA